MSKHEQTPLMKQYNGIKERYPNSILLFRLGDFFETFGDDAVITAEVCGIALTKRNNGAAGDMPLAGFPHHQIDNYLPKLVRAGHRVAVCEQMEDPKQAKGIVKRDVVEVVTPGVALYDRLLDSKKNNFLAAINISDIGKGIMLAGIAYCDISTGEFKSAELPLSKLKEVLTAINPNEIIINKCYKYELEAIIQTLSNTPTITKLEDWIFDNEFARDLISKHFSTRNLKGFGIENLSIGITAIGAIIYYVGETQNKYLKQINSLSIFNPFEYMLLDQSTRRNLEITYSANNTKDGSLYAVLDRTLTPLGARMLKNWMNNPLINIDLINQRLNIVEIFYNSYPQLLLLRSVLNQISDLERLMSKLSAQRANPRDILNIKNSLKLMPDIKEIINSISNSKELQTLISGLNNLTELVAHIENHIFDEAPVQIGTGSLFKEGIDSQLDEYVKLKYDSKQYLAEFQANERERTGIGNLKISFNNVFGYYIEISKGQVQKTPENYERRQTLANAERYITPELKEFEVKILSAEEKIMQFESALFAELITKVYNDAEAILSNSQIIATLDCLQCFAFVSTEYGYTKPIVDDSYILDIKNGRHPVVEKLLPSGESFTKNDTFIDIESEQIHIITGPNMAGKSCYLRQVGLITLMAHVGCFVPASSAHIGLVDRIFTRVGAQDSITSGESTFLVEMQEAANILNNATSRSLLLLDEVGRGTATYDGISISWAITEHLHNKINARTLFATHYHELNELTTKFDKVVNYKVDVVEAEDKIIFTHKLSKGTANHSFGIHVAKMAGVPIDVVDRANEIMHELESNEKQESIQIKTIKPKVTQISNRSVSSNANQLSIMEFQDDKIRQRLKEINMDNLTPLQAFQIMMEMKKLAD